MDKTKKIIFYLFIGGLFGMFAFSGDESSGTVGVYDADSVYNAMPRYQKALIACAKRDSAFEVDLDTVRAARKRQAIEIKQNAKTDSPYMHELRMSQLNELDSTLVYFTRVAKEDSINYRNEVMIPVYTVALVTAEYLRKEKNYVAVLKKTKLDSFRTANPSEYKIVNVTGEMITRTK